MSHSTPLGENADSLVHNNCLPDAVGDIFDEGAADGEGLEHFLSRPIEVANYTWGISGNIHETIVPLTAFLSNSAVDKKLANYAYMKANFEVHLYVKATKFHGGALLVSLWPGGMEKLANYTDSDKILTRSQRHHVDVSVGASTSAVINVPFIWPENYFNLLDTNTNAELLPKVHIDSYAELRGVGTTDPITIKVVIVPKGLKLMGPTLFASDGDSSLDLSLHTFEACARMTKHKGPDEYKKEGPISSVATAVAAASGALSNLPIIGPFALATQIGANAVSGIAQIFGFSRPAVIADPTLMRPLPLGSVALTDAKDTTNKLTLTSKQEITVDPTTTGLDSTDELSFDFLKKVESVIGVVEWDPQTVLDDPICEWMVTPCMAKMTYNATYGYEVTPTCLYWLSQPFLSWSGSLKYRVQIVGTQLHNGKLAVYYDPYYSPTGSASDRLNTEYYFLVDLAECRDFTFSIAWKQSVPYLDTNVPGRLLPYSSPTFGAPTITASADTRQVANGKIRLQVFNELVVADGVTPVDIIVKMSAGDDFELKNYDHDAIWDVNPNKFVASDGESGLDLSAHVFEACASEQTDQETAMEVGASKQIALAPDEPIQHPKRSLVFYGEDVESLRPLLKRYTYLRTFRAAMSNLSTYEIQHSQYPLYPGFDTDGPDTHVVNGINHVGTSMFSYWQMAYSWWRGSIRYKVDTQADKMTIIAAREPGRYLQEQKGTWHVNTLTTYATPDDLMAITDTMHQFGSGAALARTDLNGVLEYESPYQQPLRMSAIGRQEFYGLSSGERRSTIQNAKAYGDNVQVHIMPSVDDPECYFRMLVAAGEDFSFYGFGGAPKFYRYGFV
jgi:hypothetical protein